MFFLVFFFEFQKVSEERMELSLRVIIVVIFRGENKYLQFIKFNFRAEFSINLIRCLKKIYFDNFDLREKC